MKTSTPQQISAAQGRKGLNVQALSLLTESIASLSQEVLRQRHSQLLRQISMRKPKSPNVLFFGRENFSDNSKYLYLHAASRRKEELGFTPIWCTFNAQLAGELQRRGLSAFFLGANINQSLQFLLSAPVAVFCTNPREALQVPLFDAALEGCFRLQLWHGVGTKKLDLMLSDQMDLLNIQALESLCLASSVDAVLSPSAQYDALWRQSFGVEQIVRAGLPRNEVLLRPATELEKLGGIALPVNDNLPKILFAPTFALAGHKPLWSDADVIAKIRAGLPGGKGHVFVKPHPFDATEARNLPRLEGAFLIQADADLYPVLKEFDVLVTDKSSMLSDYLLVDKPIVLLEGKQDDLRAENPYSEVKPGLSATRETLSEAISQALTEDTMVANRAHLRSRIFETDPRQSCWSLTNVLSSLVQKQIAMQKRSYACMSEPVHLPVGASENTSRRAPVSHPLDLLVRRRMEEVGQ